MMIYNIIIHNKKNHLITEKLQITEIMNEKLLNVIMLKNPNASKITLHVLHAKI